MSTLIIITGASRGYGRSLAIEFTKTVKENSVFVCVKFVSTYIIFGHPRYKRKKIIMKTMDDGIPHHPIYLVYQLSFLCIAYL